MVPEDAQLAKATSVTRQLDVLLLGAAKKSVAADIVGNVETVGQTLVKKGVLTDKELTELKTLAKDAADKMKALDKLSGRDIAKSMKIKKQETILNADDDSGVIDLDAEDDDQAFVTSVKTETDWATNEADKEIVDGEIDLGKDAKDNAVKAFSWKRPRAIPAAVSRRGNRSRETALRRPNLRISRTTASARRYRGNSRRSSTG